MFRDRKLLIATKHEKEKVIAPVLERELGVQCFTIPDLDTDQLGTFTGEIERKDDPLTTARNKCLMAMERSGCDLAVASEGSFGPHPGVFLLPANEEILILIDRANDLEIVARELDTQTNFSGQEVTTRGQLESFAQQAGFPSHGLILRNERNGIARITKGIMDHEQLTHTFNDYLVLFGKAFVETDMRAMFNPSRMKVIAAAAVKLADKAKHLCPHCATPGFSVTEAVAGLPCSFCGIPTRSTLKWIYTCRKCGYTNELLYPSGKKNEDPMYCDVCNP